MRGSTNRKDAKKNSNVFGIVVIVLLVGWGILLWWWVSSHHSIGSNSGIVKQDDIQPPIFHNSSINVSKEPLPKFKKPTVSAETKDESEEEEGDPVHVIFSTDCKPFMDYQTLLLFHSAMVVGHKGPVTRIVSGCTKEKEADLRALYKKLYPQYHVHFTPDFSYDPIKDTHYVYFNKPYGLKHWLEHADPPVGPETVVALLDPDMILLRPMTSKVRGMGNLQYTNIKEEDLFDKVDRGHPIGAIYGLGAPWARKKHRHFNKYEICEEGSPCLSVEEKYGGQHYSVGPPYILHRDDMLRVASSWCRYAPKVHKQYPELLAEMYAYSIAAAHEELPHLQVSSLMVSNIYMNGDEGWLLVDALEDSCEPPVNGIYQPGKPVPSVVHFCQTYRSGKFGWAKRRPDLLDIFTCNKGLLAEPADDLSFLDYKIVKGKVKKMNNKMIKRNAFIVCTTVRMVNAAAIFYKEQMCDMRTANTTKDIILEPQQDD